MNLEVIFYIQVKQLVIANTTFLDLMETITLPTSILVGKPTIIKENNE